MANAVGPQEISKLSHSEKFNKGKLGSFVYAPDHYFSTLDITQRRRSNIQAVYFIGWFPSTNTGFSFLFVRPQCVFPPRKCYTVSWCELVHVGGQDFDFSNGNWATHASCGASFIIVAWLLDAWWESKMFTSVGEVSCHRVIVRFIITRHYTGFLVRFVTDFVLLEVRFNSSTCVNCWWFVWLSLPYMIVISPQTSPLFKY